jgi:hypothetical protein
VHCDDIDVRCDSSAGVRRVSFSVSQVCASRHEEARWASRFREVVCGIRIRHDELA